VEKAEAETLMSKRNAAQINDEKLDAGSEGLQKRTLASKITLERKNAKASKSSRHGTPDKKRAEASRGLLWRARGRTKLSHI